MTDGLSVDFQPTWLREDFRSSYPSYTSSDETMIFGHDTFQHTDPWNLDGQLQLVEDFDYNQNESSIMSSHTLPIVVESPLDQWPWFPADPVYRSETASSVDHDSGSQQLNSSDTTSTSDGLSESMPRFNSREASTAIDDRTGSSSCRISPLLSTCPIERIAPKYICQESGCARQFVERRQLK